MGIFLLEYFSPTYLYKIYLIIPTFTLYKF